MQTRTALSLIALAALTACATQPMRAPFNQADLPAAVQVPAGNKVALEHAAAGDVNYQCRAKKDMAGQFEWVFVGPDAKLMDRAGKAIGRYFGPPATWESNDGSKVTATQVTSHAFGKTNREILAIECFVSSKTTTNNVLHQTTLPKIHFMPFLPWWFRLRSTRGH